ncbi:MAG TPA: DMT family transporter [Anaerolineae bacterium]|nr:DMT family transporter [Anaerolineae bacterium]
MRVLPNAHEGLGYLADSLVAGYMNLQSSRRLGRTDLIVIAVVAIWGVNLSVVKSAVSGPGAPFTPFAFNALRFSVASTALLIMLRRAGDAVPTSRREWTAILGIGLLGNTVYQALFITGIDHTSPANSALIAATTPVIVALIGAALRVERLGLLAWIGVVMSFAGIAAVVLGNASGAAGEARTSSLVGDLLILTAAVVWAVYTLLVASLLRRYSAMAVTALSVAAGTVLIVIMALPDLSRLEWDTVPPAAWSAAVFSGLFALAVGHAGWNQDA